MDNKQAIEDIKEQKRNKEFVYNNLRHKPEEEMTQKYIKHIQALDKAIASLEAWDKINEELEKEMNEYENVLSDLSYSDGVGYALAVIDEHIGGES